MPLCDTGVLLAAGNVKDHAHRACLKLLRQAQGPLVVPSPVLGEIGYLLQSRAGPQAEVTFLESFGDDGFHLAGWLTWSERIWISHSASSTPQ